MSLSAPCGWWWPAVCVVLLCVWLWTVWQYRRPVLTAPSLAARPPCWCTEPEDLLKVAYTLQREKPVWSGDELARHAGLPETVADEVTEALVAAGWAEKLPENHMRLTGVGEARVQELIRAHRLWERYLVDREGMAVEAVHAEADRREHETMAEGLETLDAALGHPAWDPHGHVIPAPQCHVPLCLARALAEEGVVGSRLRIVCLDDEPAVLLAQLLALGLKPGVDVEVLAEEPTLLRLQVEEHVVPLATAAARHVFVLPAATLPLPLGELPVGSQARVVEIAGSGKHQRRMLDMGFVPGAGVEVIRSAPLGDPTEYVIKGTAVALRKEDADSIMVDELEAVSE